MSDDKMATAIREKLLSVWSAVNDLMITIKAAEDSGLEVRLAAGSDTEGHRGISTTENQCGEPCVTLEKDPKLPHLSIIRSL